MLWPGHPALALEEGEQVSGPHLGSALAWPEASPPQWLGQHARTYARKVGLDTNFNLTRPEL